MSEYRIYSLGPNGRIKSARPFVCDDDFTVFVEGEKISANGDVEIWEGSRFVARLERKPVATNSPVQSSGARRLSMPTQNQQTQKDGNQAS